MRKIICVSCGKPATRMSLRFMEPNEHISWLQRRLRKWFPRSTAQRVPECDTCFYMSEHGLYSFQCVKCGRDFKIDIGDFHRMEQEALFCPFCKADIVWEGRTLSSGPACEQGPPNSV